MEQQYPVKSLDLDKIGKHWVRGEELSGSITESGDMAEEKWGTTIEEEMEAGNWEWKISMDDLDRMMNELEGDVFFFGLASNLFDEVAGRPWDEKIYLDASDDEVMRRVDRRVAEGKNTWGKEKWQKKQIKEGLSKNRSAAQTGGFYTIDITKDQPADTLDKLYELIEEEEIVEVEGREDEGNA
jgi:hypothetical protein